MSKTAVVVLRDAISNDIVRHEVAPGDTLVVTTLGISSAHHTPAKGPQPEAKWSGTGAVYRMGPRGLQYKREGVWSDCGTTTLMISNAGIDFLRFCADLREATEKWHAS